MILRSQSRAAPSSSARESLPIPKCRHGVGRGASAGCTRYDSRPVNLTVTGISFGYPDRGEDDRAEPGWGLSAALGSAARRRAAPACWSRRAAPLLQVFGL